MTIANNKILRELDFAARAEMERAAVALDLKIIRAYKEAQLNVFKKIESYKNSSFAGLDPELVTARVRLEALKAQIDSELVKLGVTVEGVTRDAMALGVDKSQVIAKGSNKVLETNGPAWTTFLASDAAPYLRSGALLKGFPASVETYGNLVTFFERQNVEYFDGLLKGLNLQQDILINLKWGSVKEIKASVAAFKKLGIDWKPLVKIEEQLRLAVIERISYKELVTRLRHEAWRLAPGARVPGVTYQATRLARTEMIKASSLASHAWGFETPGIYGFRRWFGGGACNGICLQFVGYWSYNGNQPVAIPVHPNGACYDTYETDPRPKQHHQDIMQMENGLYMDRMTFEHRSVLAERAGETMPVVSRRLSLSGSNRFGERFGTNQEMLTHVQEHRLHRIN